MEQYSEYKAIGGKIAGLPQDDLLRLYHGMGALNKLPAEDIPYTMLLSYAVKFANSGNYKIALAMLRSGQLLDELKRPEEYDMFVEVFLKAKRPENLLMRKYKAAAYSGLAEAFFRVSDYDYCKKVCDYKKQFYASKMSSRDNELLTLSQTAGIPDAPAP